MPRGGRVLLPHCPHHIVHRGHNRQVVFAQDTDFQRYLADLRELEDAFGVKVCAYCLMTNHVHLLLVPDDACAGLSQLMKTLAARATRYRNRLEGRTGTLWESRFKSSIVQSDTYLLACCRYGGNKSVPFFRMHPDMQKALQQAGMADRKVNILVGEKQ